MENPVAIYIYQIIDTQKNWVIRSIKKDDIQKLTWGRVYRPYINLMKLSLNDHLWGKKVYLVVEINNKIAGQIIIDWRILKDQTKSDGKTRAYLYSFRVFPPYRSRGLGSAMVKFCEDFLRKRGFLYSTIACEKNNPRAQKLYEKLGYKIYKEEESQWEFVDHKGVTRKVREPEWIMEKALKQESVNQ